jgi:hypothetical protein
VITRTALAPAWTQWLTLVRSPLTFGVGIAIGVWVQASFVVRDTPSDPFLSIVAATFAVTVAWRLRFPPELALLGAVAVATASWSMALGSTWAALTWWPVAFAAVAAGRLGPHTLMGATLYLLLENAPAVALIQAGTGAPGFSGSPLYFNGFVGAVAAPIWMAYSLSRGSGLLTSASYSAGSLITALAIWMALASGSRAAILAMAMAMAFVLLAYILRLTSGQQVPWARSLGTVVLVSGLVWFVDISINMMFTDAVSSIVSVLATHVDSTVSEIGTSTGSIGTRFAYWAQAWEATVARPSGHGLGSYPHVIHAYQRHPMLWSGNPHSIWALIGVELGLAGVILLGVLVARALARGITMRSATIAPLVAAAVVMSLDVFSSMPIYASIWWMSIGTAFAPVGLSEAPARTGRPSRLLHFVTVAVIIGVCTAAIAFALRLAADCTAPCEPILAFGGNPQVIGQPLSAIGYSPGDHRWDVWESRYPLAFWLAADRARSSEVDSHGPRLSLELLARYPYQSPDLYASVAESLDAVGLSQAVAGCGLERIFDGRAIYAGSRASRDHLIEVRQRLVALAGDELDGESGCSYAGIPLLPIGLARD